MTEPLWRPSQERIAKARVSAFMDHVAGMAGGRPADFAALHAWSIAHPEAFWTAVWDFCGVVGERGGPALVDREKMPGARFFPQARLNFAENLLRRQDDGDALVFRGEGGRKRMSWRTLREAVSRLSQGLRAAGIRPGDRVAAFVPNLPETIVAVLATAAVGAVWSSCSPDFGPRGVVDRFGQIQPKLLFTADGYVYGGKRFDSLARVREFLPELATVERIVVLPYLTDTPALDGLPQAVTLADFVAPHTAGDIAFERLPFNSPLYILYSSGTTGVPKCIVHGIGGTLLQHLKEHALHSDIRASDRVLYFTTTGWMMWNWLVTALAAEATLLLYDGSPFHPDGNVLFDFAQDERCTFFGTSAKYIDACAKAGVAPAETHDLSSVRTMASTGSPLVPESFDYVYARIKQDLCLSSISGGTDIVSCFVLGNPTGPVWRGEIQARGLGMQVEVWDDEGRPVVGEKGELICAAPFPSMPLGFWNDPDGAKYRAAYFERFPGVWHHGDYAEVTAHGGVVIYGRSDAVLNPGGVRIGTAEIYRQVEQLPEIVESIVVGQDWQGDVRVVLFVRLREGVSLDEPLRARIRDQIRRNASPRHVPAVIAQVGDIPRTRSGKIAELAVRDVIHGRVVKNREALANPEALALYAGLPELA